MKNFHIFLDPTGTWRGNEFPEEPKFDSNENVHFTAFGNAWKEYEAAVEKLKSEALVVSNPEVAVDYDADGMILQGGIKAVPGVLYPWDGGWEKIKTCKWDGNRDACGNETCEDLQECQKSPEKWVLRLLPKSPVIPEGSKAISLDGHTSQPPCKLQSEYKTSDTEERAGIVAIGGIEERGETESPLFSPEEELWISHIDKIKELPTLEALGYLLDLVGIKDVHEAAPSENAQSEAMISLLEWVRSIVSLENGQWVVESQISSEKLVKHFLSEPDGQPSPQHF